MAYSIRLPDGTLVRNIPDELSPEEAKARIIKAYPQYAPESSTLRQAADIPVQVGRGAVMGVRMLSDAIGADNPVSQALRGAEDYLGDLLSAEAKQDQKEIARILKDAEDKGVLDQVKAGIEALTVAPVDLVSQVLGTAVPTIAAGMAGAAAKLGAVGIGTLQAGTGATMGAGLAKGNIFDVVKEELTAAGVDEKIAEERARAAQNYTGENWDQIILGGVLGGAAALGPLERIFARLPAISPQTAAKNIFARSATAGVAEAVPEAAQAFQEQVAQNIALQREGFDVPTFRGAVANATLEGLAGFGIGAPIGALEGKPGAKQPPGQQAPAEPTAPPPPTPITEEGELTPEEEAELQARIAAAPPPPAAGLPVAPTPTPPTPVAPQQVTATPEAVALPETQQMTPPPTLPAEAAPELEALSTQLAQIQQARMDPTLTPDDPVFLELDQQEAAIQTRIQQLTATPAAVTQPPAQPPAPPVAPVVEPEVIPEEAVVEAPVVTPPAVITPPPAPVITPQEAPPVITPPAAPTITAPPAVETPVIEEPVARSKEDVQTELNRIRTSLKKAKTAVKKKLMPESEVTSLEARVSELEDELAEAKAGPRQIKYRSAKGNTWTGKGKAPPKWLREKLAAGYELSDFEIRPELGNKSEVELELEKPLGFGRPAPATRPPPEYERAARELEAAETTKPNLFSALTSKVSSEDAADVGTGPDFAFLRAAKGRGKPISEIISDGELDAYLPPDMRPGSETFNAKKASEYLKDLLRQDPATDPEARLTYESREFLIPILRNELDRLEAELEPEDVNQLIQEIVAEERAAIADIEAGAIAEQERGPGVPGVPADFALEGQTPEELAELQRRELSGEAEAERDRLEAEEAARAAAEAERKIADQKRETFDLAPPPSAPTTRAAAPSGDLFGTAGITEQPTRAPRAVAAEPSPIEKLAAEQPTEDAQYAQDALNEYVDSFRDKLPSKGKRSYDAQTNTVTDVLTAKGDVTMSRADFDALVSIAKTSDSATGRKYSIVVEDTPEKSSIFTFQPRGLKATDPRVPVFAQLEETNRYVEELTLDEQIEKSLKEDGLDDPAKASKKYQEEFGISKPVADALVRAEIERNETTWKQEYGAGTEADAKAANKKYWDLKSKAEEISKQKRVAEKEKPSTKKTREVAEGTVVERIELPENVEVRIVKLKDGYSVYQYDLDSDQIVMGQQRQFRAPAFKNDQDAYRAAEAFADEMFDKAVPKQPEKMRAAMEERLSRGEDVINNKTPNPDIPADQRLVLMSCCATKNKGMGMGPAMDVYTGVFFQTFKNKVKDGAMPNLRILSAKYGFINPDQRIEIYDQVMDKATADKFMVDDKLVEGFPSNIKDVLIVGSDQYQRVMKAAIEDLIKAGKIDKGASINVTKGGIGEQRAQLGRYLASLPASKEKGASKTPSEFYQQMLPDAGFKRLAQGSDRTYKNKSGEEFLTFERDGVRVAVKSNTQLYADDRGVGMYMGEGNDLLIQAMIVDESARRQGKATKALQDILSMADQAGMTSYIEPVQMTKDVGMTTEQLKDFYKRFGFKPQKTEPATDRVMIREPGAKIEAAKQEVEAPTITPGQQRNLNYWRENVAPAIRDYLTAYKNVGVERLERSNFKPEGISATEWLLKVRSQKSVFGKGGRKVSETGIQMLSKKDLLPTVSGDGEVLRKAMLKAIQAINKAPGYTSDWIENMEAGSYDGIPDFEPRKEEKPKVGGMSITEIMAETEKVRQQLVEMGVDPDPTYRPKDTSKEEREAKEAKKRKELTRLAGESSRIEKLTKEPIIANAEQRSAAERLARSVNGELLFLDGSRGLGIVFAKDREGNDAYLPIHGGKISRVDVRDFTGLKSTDQAYLKRVRSELVRDAGARQKRKDDEADWEFMNIEFDMPNDRQRDLFGSTTEAKQIAEAMEPKAKKLPPGRSPELTTAARAVQAGAMTAAEYNALVDKYKPIPLYAEPLKPATSQQVFDALDVKKREQINPQIPNGTKVGLRLDIPAFNRKGVFVVSIHQKRTASAPGKVIGYGSVAKAKNVTFGVGNQLKALEIAAGSAKDALQTIEGEYVNVTPEQAFAEAQRAIKDPSYVQVGIDPTRHAYFYDRRTTLPVVSAEEVIQIGNMILAKKPTFGKKEDFLYSIEAGPIDDGSQDAAKRANENKEALKDLQGLRREKIVLPEKVRNYGSTAEGQRVIAALNMTAQELDKNLSQQKYDGYTAQNFMRQARKARDDGSMSADVFGVIQATYMDDPKLLDGLRLDVKEKFSPEEIAQRRAEGKKIPLGAFAPLERVVNLYTGTRGLTDPTTIRHELTHTLEQMMTPAQRKAVINSYFAAMQKAAKKHKDAKSQEFFDNVIKYLNEPFPENREAMNKSLPSIDFYQFTSPSEYWAVNAEKLMAQRLGTAWDRFKKAVRKMLEKMKNLLGFDNSFVVHDVFDKIMSGSRERMTTSMLMEFIKSDGQNYEFLENIEDDAELVRRYNRADTPMLDHAPMRRMMINAATFTKDMFKDMAQNPSEALRMMFNSVNRGIMYLRNKNIWFGSGINEADRIRYNGQLKTAEGLATASLALDNMIRGGNIGTQVVFQGGIEFNKDTQMYTAVQKEKSMTKVYEAEAKLKERLGEQLGTNIIQGYLEAKRSRSIKEEVETRKEIVDGLTELIDEQVAELKALDADPKATKQQKDAVNRELRKSFKEFRQAKEELDTIRKIAEEKVTMSEAEIEDFISREEAHPELKEIIENFGAVNQNLLRFWKDVGLLSDPRYARLAAIKDYVPWYRIMNDEEDVHSPLQATTRSATNIGKEKLFKSGKPSVINDFVIEEGQDVFKIQPSRINAVKLNGIRLKPDQYESTPNGEVRLKVEYKPNDVLVIETQREIENMIDNMTRNVMRMTMNGLRKYAANRIVSEYATRDSKGQIMTFPKVDREKGRFDYIDNGRRTVVEIQDPLIAEAVLGMETVGMEMWKPLAAAANFTRRTITLSPVFQLKQVFKDAPTAALVTGVKNPAALMGGVMRDFIGAVRDNDPVAEILRSQGIGGFYSPARTPEADVKRRIGIINNNAFDYTMKALDHFGDSSDMAQRIAIYKRVMAETGDESLALYQAANVINFLRHGSGQVAQALVKTVPFLNAYAQSIDVLYNALVGGGLRGKDRAAALKQLAITGSLLAGTTLLYAMLVGDDDDYMKMDDQSKIRSYMIPGTDVVLPMNTSAAFFFKAIPELIYNKVVNEGTENEVDAKRLRTAMKEAAVDLLLGPTPVPSAVKPIIEISLDYNFFTSRPITPRGMDNLDAYQQYDMRTSEAAKLISGLTGTKENRLLNPMEADHLVRSIFGTAGAMVAWSSNLVGQASEFRPEMGLKDMPVTGAFLRPEVPRGREDLFYKLKDNTDRKYRTFNRLVERGDEAEAQAYLNRHPNLIAYYDYTSEMDTQLKEINAAIRFIGETKDPSYTPEIKRREIQDLLNLKQDILEGIEQFRKEAYSE